MAETNILIITGNTAFTKQFAEKENYLKSAFALTNLFEQFFLKIDKSKE